MRRRRRRVEARGFENCLCQFYVAARPRSPPARPARAPRSRARAPACVPGARLLGCHSAAQRSALCCTGCGVCAQCKTLTVRLRVMRPARPPAPAHNLRLAQNPDSADAGNNGLYIEIKHMEVSLCELFVNVLDAYEDIKSDAGMQPAASPAMINCVRRALGGSMPADMVEPYVVGVLIYFVVKAATVLRSFGADHKLCDVAEDVARAVAPADMLLDVTRIMRATDVMDVESLVHKDSFAKYSAMVKRACRAERYDYQRQRMQAMEQTPVLAPVLAHGVAAAGGGVAQNLFGAFT